jgi:Holliday junction resolvase
MSRGHDRERAVKALLIADDWFVTRAAGSLGDADLVALKRGAPPRLIEVKSDVRSPWVHFGPERRREMRHAARQAGAEAWMCWWPPRKKPQWVYEDDWPASPAVREAA